MNFMVEKYNKHYQFNMQCNVPYIYYAIMHIHIFILFVSKICKYINIIHSAEADVTIFVFYKYEYICI